MLWNLTLNDTTQKQILPHLHQTDKLLTRVATNLSATQKESQIYCMPDLGIPHNATRVLGGFYTGAYYAWDCDVPFVAVDSTVNVCGTGVYKLKEPITPEDFHSRVTHVFSENTKYTWNYDKGNHLVMLAHSNGKYGLEEGQYLVVHASAIEYKNDLKQGLYPVEGNWYYDKIKTEYDKTSNRYLRYIKGRTAEKFYRIAASLKDFNEQRNIDFAHFVLEDLYEKELIRVSHYGIPTVNSVCIGCHWENRPYPLLTAPGQNIFLISPNDRQHSDNIVHKEGSKLFLSPHGLGVEFTDSHHQISYQKNNVCIGEKAFYMGDSIHIDTDSRIRCSNSTYDNLYTTVSTINQLFNGTIIGELEQICAITKRGFSVYQQNTISI